ncbi:MAG: hypothetical protein QG639_598 [Patescibacteria group bacterium]|jgi:glycosyltransferase involved in cell wall biosynthesis|nr:hypothetical protein [Patescibacteria group bacterium]
MPKKPVVLSIIIATYNSEKLIEKCLKAVQRQTLKPSSYEILVIDGGSTDKTLAIADKYHAKIINNPRKEPVWAKFLGLQQAKGRYILYLDSDEIIVSPESLYKKLIAFKEPNVRSVIGNGYLSPANMPFVNDYINEFGDPFSFFIYRLSKNAGFFLDSMKQQYSYQEKQGFTVFNFDKSKPLPIIELAAMASSADRDYLVKKFPKVLKDMSLLPHFFYLLASENQKLAIVHDDPLYHYSSDTLANYLKKIAWRVQNNIYHISSLGKSGFSGRETFQPRSLQLRRYLFLPYAYSLVFPLLDSLLLAISRKNWKYVLHVPLTVFTATAIVYHLVLFISGYRPQIEAYGKK